MSKFCSEIVTIIFEVYGFRENNGRFGEYRKEIEGAKDKKKV